MLNQRGLLEALLSELRNLDDSHVSQVIANVDASLVAVESRALGIASWAAPHPVPIDALPKEPLPDSASELSRYLLHDNAYHASLGLAAFNSVLPPPSSDLTQRIKAQELILKYGRGNKVAVIGHFPFVEKMDKEFARLWVLEKRPRPGDLEWKEAPAILPQANLVAISSTTLANGTLADILQWTPHRAKKILLGPSTPLSGVLFDHGLDALGGILVRDGSAVKCGIREGCSFKQLKGVEYVVWESNKKVR